MKRCVFLLALSLCWTLPLAAEEAAAPAAEPTAPMDTTEQCRPADLAESTLDPGGSAQETATICEAFCGDGTRLRVNCNGTCTATDQQCSGGSQTVAGKVTCNNVTTQTCPESACHFCRVETTCPDGTILSCQASDQFSCDGGDPFCYVTCDWVTEWCPGHFGEELCEI